MGSRLQVYEPQDHRALSLSLVCMSYLCLQILSPPHARQPAVLAGWMCEAAHLCSGIPQQTMRPLAVLAEVLSSSPSAIWEVN